MPCCARCPSYGRHGAIYPGLEIGYASSDLALPHGSLSRARRLNPIGELTSLIGWHEPGNLKNPCRASAAVGKAPAGQTNRLAKLKFVRHCYAPQNHVRRAYVQQHKKAAPRGGGSQRSGAERCACTDHSTYAASMLLTAILPLRRSSAVSKETFCPSTSPCMPARSRAVA